MKNILVFSGSPRKGGNTDLLADALCEGAEEGLARVEKIRLINIKIGPCIECGACDTTGQCILDDDMVEIYPKLEAADVVVVASPIFFYNITATTQALVERSQALWIRKYRLDTKEDTGNRRLGIFISVGATKGKRLFDGSLLVMKYFFDAIGAKLAGALLFKGVEKKAEIKGHPTALASARELGVALAQGEDVSGIRDIWLP